MAGGAANLAVALFGNEASNNLVAFPPEVNIYGMLDAGALAHGSDQPLAGAAGALSMQ
jgi:hypothetical protein